MIKINDLKRAAHMNQHGKLFAKLFEANTNLLKDMMPPEYPPPPYSKSSSTYQLTSSRNHIIILVEVWVSCLIRRNGCGSNCVEVG